MLRIAGYAIAFPLHPGEEIRFCVNSERSEPYRAELVRLIHGDTNPEGPGYKEALVASSINGDYPGKHQRIYAGSYAIVPDHPRLRVRAFYASGIYLSHYSGQGLQGLITKWGRATACGYGLFIDDDATLALWVGDGTGRVERVSSGKPLLRNVWYSVAASFDPSAGRMQLYQEPIVTRAMAVTACRCYTRSRRRRPSSRRRPHGSAGRKRLSALEAAYTEQTDSGRSVSANLQTTRKPLGSSNSRRELQRQDRSTEAVERCACASRTLRLWRQASARARAGSRRTWWAPGISTAISFPTPPPLTLSTALRTTSTEQS